IGTGAGRCRRLPPQAGGGRGRLCRRPRALGADRGWRRGLGAQRRRCTDRGARLERKRRGARLRHRGWRGWRHRSRVSNWFEPALPLLRPRGAARCGTRVPGAKRVIGNPVPDLALPEQCDTEITAHLERLAIRTEAHQGAIDLAVARVHDRSALVRQSVSLHPPDERQALHRTSLIGALALVADPIRVLARLEEDFGEGAFVDSVALRDLEPAFGLAGSFVDLFPEAYGRRLGGAQLQG